MIITIIGTRGIPPRYGGFETFAFEISSILVNHGFKVYVQCDPGVYYQPNYDGVGLIFSSVPKTGHQLRYYYEGIKWGLKNSDILLVAGSGGSIFYFLNFFHRKVIVTNPDGLEFKRSKWPLPVRLYWRFADFMAAKLSDYIVADSASIGNHFRYKYNLDASKLRIIEYGAHVNSFFDNEILDKYHLKHKEYYLVVCRFEPENNLHVILDGFIKADPKYKIVVVGNHSVNRYGRNLLRKFQSDKIIFTGGIYDKPELAALRYSCRAYLHGHSVGGTNPSLLEAMASSNPIICHDNVFNREVTADKQLYFKNAGDCAQRISEIGKMDENELSEYGKAARQRITDYYNWDIIGHKYLDFLDNIIRNNNLKNLNNNPAGMMV